MKKRSRIDELILRSSLGSVAALRLRKRTPAQLARELVDRADQEVRGNRASRAHIEVDRCNRTRKDSLVAQKNDRHVVRNPAGGWDVKKPGADRASSHHDTQGDAERRAKDIVRGAGGGEVFIHGRDGRIRDKDTVAPGNDPNPPKDTKH